MMAVENVFHIEFQTEDGPGLLATRVELRSEYIKEMDATVNVALCDHPLYPKLEQYVLANPSPPGRKL